MKALMLLATIALLLVAAFAPVAFAAPPAQATTTPAATSATTVATTAPITATTIATTAPITSTTVATTVPISGTTAAATPSTPAATPTPTLPPVKGGTLRVSVDGDLKGLDPQVQTLFVYAYSLRHTVFETLITVDQQMKFVPMLATEWKFTDDQTLNMKLREGAKFHDGKVFNADDVKFSLERVLNPDTGASQLSGQLKPIASVEIVSPTEVNFKCSAPCPAALDSLLFLPILSQQSIATVDTKPVGTGPFKFEEWLTNDHWSVVRNPDYYVADRPYLDRIAWYPIPDVGARLTNLQAGQQDLMEGLNPKDAEGVKGNANLNLIVTDPSGAFRGFQFNTANKPTDNNILRQAIATAFDRASFLNGSFYGYGRVSAGPFTPVAWAYSPILDDTYAKYDLAKAKDLLTKAGYPGGTGLSLKILTPQIDDLEQAAVLLQASLAELGVESTIDKREIPAWIDAMAAGDWHINFNGFGYSANDPAIIFSTTFIGPESETTRWRNEAYAKIVQDASSTVDQAKRKELYAQAQQILADEVPASVMAHLSQLWAESKKVHDFEIRPDLRNFYTNTWIEH